MNGNQLNNTGGNYRQSSFGQQTGGGFPFYMPQPMPWPGFATPVPQQGVQIPQMPMAMPGQTQAPPQTGVDVPGMLPTEQSFIENILRLNRGKLATVYMTFDGNREWNAKVFKGIVEAAGRDHLILSDPETGYRYLLPMVFFSYAVFEDELEYDYPFAGPSLATYQPR